VLVGAVIGFVGLAGVAVLMAKNGGLAFGWRAWRNLGAFLRDPARRGQRRAFFVFLGVAAVGAASMFGGVMIGDAKERGACRDACAELGYEDGRVRGDPHVERPADAARMCWCRDGDRWSEEPAGPPAPR